MPGNRSPDRVQPSVSRPTSGTERRSLPKRVLYIVAVALVLVVGGAYVLQPERGLPDGAPTEDEMATEIGAPVMEHIYRGHVEGRSGEIMLVPKPNNYIIGDWDLTTLGTGEPNLVISHPNPWNYLTKVPIVLYGPGFLGSAGLEDERQVDIADLAPTYAQLLGMETEVDYEGEPLVGPPQTNKRPKAIVTVVIDGGGWNVLQYHPGSVPTIDALREGGLTFTNATIGSAPSITGALHATFGTGVYPKTHGIPGNRMRSPEGKNIDAWLQDADPRYLETPTVSELWDEQNNNDPVVATVSYEGWHLGMIGHGAQREGGDKDVAVLWEVLDDAWFINEDYYELPEYLQTTDIARLERYERELDERDGLVDGDWFGQTLEELQSSRVRPGTPAFARFTGDAVLDVLKNEDIGRDEITDFMWVEMKMPDYAGHAWNMVAPEQGDVLLETDRQIGRMKRYLDREIGKGEYVLAVSADHGQELLPEHSGGWRINSNELLRDIEARFGPVVERISPVDIYLDMDRIESDGVSMSDLARYVGTYTIADNIPEDAPGEERVPPARLDELLFAGAFSTGYLADMTEETARSFGEGVYPEGRLYDSPTEGETAE